MSFVSFAPERLCFAVFIACALCVAPAGLRSSQAYSPVGLDPIKMPWAWTELSSVEDSENLRCLDVGADGTLWLGFNQGIVSCDGVEIRRHSEVTSRGIRSIVVASSGVVYVVAARSLWRMDEAGWHEYPNAIRIPSPSDMGVREDPQGRVWIASDSSFYLVGEEGLESRGRVSQDPISDFAIDRDGAFWTVETPSGTVRQFRPEGEGFVEVRAWRHLMEVPREPSGLRQTVVSDIFCAADGSVWVVNGHGSVAPRQLAPGAAAWGVHDLSALDGSNMNGSVYQTSDGVIRITGMGTIHRLSAEGWDVYRNPSLRFSRNLSYLKEAPDGSLWYLEKFVRVSRIDYQGDKWRLFQGMVFADETADGQRWYLGDDGCVIREEPRSGQWTCFGKEDGLIEVPSAVFVRGNGEVWATGADGGVAAASVWDGSQWKRYRFPELGRYIKSGLHAERDDGALLIGGRSVDSSGKSAALQNCLLISPAGEEPPRVVRLPSRSSLGAKRLPDGRVAVCGDDLFVLEGDVFQSLLGEARKDLPFKRIQNFEASDTGEIWIPNWGGGVVRFAQGAWTFYGEEEGLSSRYVADLHILNNGEVAALTAAGLDRFDGKSWYSLSVPGIQGASGVSHLRQSRDGSIWVNTENGYWDMWFDHQLPIECRFTSLRYRPGNKPPETEIAVLSEPRRYAKSVWLGWVGKDSEFEGSDLSLSYSYRIDEQDWSPFSKEKNAYLQDLEPGSRRIYARARDEDGNIDPTPAVLDFEIRIPYWERGWFLVTIVVLLVAFVASLLSLLVQRLRHAAALDGMRLRFLTNLSHELRSPLMLIMGPLEKVVSLSPLGSELEEEASMALRSAERLNELVDQLLELRKIAVEPERGRQEPCELVGFVETLVSDFDRLGQSIGQRVTFCCNIDSVWLIFDQDAYRKILDNLILNALKHSENGAVTRLELTVSDTSGPDGRDLRITVSDEGTGIAKDALPHLFEAFYVGKSGSLPGVRSFGLGLALVRELAELNDGEVGVESPILLSNGTRRGARFTVDFRGVNTCPAVVEAFPREASPADSKHQAEGTVRPLLLIADDNEEIRGFLARELVGSYDVIAARDGKEALQLATKEMPDLILADVIMPQLSGIELCQELRRSEATRHIPIILQTASTEDAVWKSGLDAGAIDFIAKPFSVSSLKTRISNILYNRDQFARRMKVRMLNKSDVEVASVEAVFARRVQDVVERNLSDPDFSAAKLGAELGLGKSTCYRKIMDAFGASPSHFIKNYRLERSIAFLEQGGTATEVALSIGYAEPSSYNRAFKKYFGHTPANYKKVQMERRLSGGVPMENH